MKKIIKNFLSLTSINICSLLISLLIVPYLIDNLGMSQYGEYALYFIITQFISVLIDYGFDVYAIKKVNEEPERCDKFFYQVLYIRFVIFSLIVCLLLLSTAVFTFNLQVCILLFLSNITFVVSSNWFFQYKEKMFPIALINFIGRLVYLFLILNNNAITIFDVSLYYFISSLIISILSVYILWLNGLTCFKLIYISNSNEIFSILKSSTGIFSYRLSSSLFTPMTSLIINYFFGFYAVGLFDLFNKVSGIINMFSFSFVQSIYPIMARRKIEFIKIKPILYYMISNVILFISCYIIFNLLYDGFNQLAVKFANELSNELMVMVPFILLGAFFVSVNTFMSRVLVLYDYHNVVFYFTLVSLPLTLCFEIFILPYLASIYVILSVVMFQLIMFILMLRKYFLSVYIYDGN
ncbi:lipopolysaccharide biosynthesis protein [Photobacterium damselae subsp. damselae]